MVSVDDLRVAIDWLNAYSSDDDDKTEHNACTRVAEMLAAQVTERLCAAAARELSKKTGRRITASMIKAKL